MTEDFRLWGDVPPGTPVHFHCSASQEGPDSRKWTDPRTTSRAVIAWTPEQVVDWRRETLEKFRDRAHADYQERLDHWLTGDGSEWCWRASLVGYACGKWSADQYTLGEASFLVVRVLPYADTGTAPDPGRPGHHPYAVCTQHPRPTDTPYTGPDRTPEQLAAYGQPVSIGT